MKLLVVAVMCFAAACGPGLVQQDVRDTGREALVGAIGSASELEELFHDSIVNGGLWFADPTCQSQFAQPGEIAKPQQAAFAACLVGLHLQASKRVDALGDVVVMAYPPGIEVEARIASELDGEHLSWIGFESRRADDAFAPTITADMLATLRTGGDPTGPLPEKVAATTKLDPLPNSHAQFAWIKLCLDDTGAISDVRVTEATSWDVAEGFKNAMMTWSFKPLELGGRATPTCAMLRLAYPAGQAPAIETLPLPSPPKRDDVESLVFAAGIREGDRHRIAGHKLITPDPETKVAISKSHRSRIAATFRVCMDVAGNVIEVLPMRSSGFADYDREIINMIRSTWRYAPMTWNGAARPFCTAVTFIYSQR